MSKVTAKLTTGTVVRITNGRHEWTGDEPAAAGGTDTGPDPYELLLGALAACTCATISLYCQHKGLKLESVSASYDFSRVHADDCADCDDDAKGLIEHVASDVQIKGDFDAAQQKRLAQVAQRCPVHKTLAHGVQFTDRATF